LDVDFWMDVPVACIHLVSGRSSAIWCASDKIQPGGSCGLCRIKRDETRLDAYLERLAKIDPESLAREERFAFYINAWTIKLILSGYPGVTSIKKLGSLFKSPWKEIRYMSAAFLSGSVKTSTTTSSAFSKSTHLAS